MTSNYTERFRFINKGLFLYHICHIWFNICEHVSKLTILYVKVIVFAMDGDSTYRKLRTLFHNEYEKKIRMDASFDKFAQITSHWLLVMAFTFLNGLATVCWGSQVHGWLTANTGEIDVSRLAEISRQPSKVFGCNTFDCNQKFTKCTTICQ